MWEDPTAEEAVAAADWMTALSLRFHWLLPGRSVVAERRRERATGAHLDKPRRYQIVKQDLNPFMSRRRIDQSILYKEGILI